VARGRTMSEAFKLELAKELGFYDKIVEGGWGNITTREAGLLVREAIKKAEALMMEGAAYPPGK